MATRAWSSAIVKAPLSKVWNLVRSVDFHYLPTVLDAHLEDTATPSQVGGVRSVTYKDKTVQRIRLLELSDVNHTVTWELIESTPAISFLSAMHTVELRSVTVDSSTFISWTTDFSKDAAHEVLTDAKFKHQENFTALANTVSKGDTPLKPDAKAVEPKAEMKGPPKFVRQLSLHSKSLLTKAFDKLDLGHKGKINRDAAIKYCRQVAKAVSDTFAFMPSRPMDLIAAFAGSDARESAESVLKQFQPEITFEEFSNYFKSAQLPDETLEQVLENKGFEF